MPSPIAHASPVLLVRKVVERHDGVRQAVAAQPAFLYIAAVVTMWAPDVDFVLRALVDQPSLQHGGATHSLSAGVLLGVVFAVACRLRYGASLPIVPVISIGIGCGWSHALMDAATYGSGTMLLWPFSLDRYRTPVPLFFGARHSRPTAWGLHLITLISELLFVALLWWLARAVRWPGRQASIQSAARRDDARTKTRA